MVRREASGLVGALLIALLAGCGGGAGATFRNPVHASDFPDPFVLRAGDTYYAYATNAGGKEVQTLTSSDLVHWRTGRDALPHVGAWAYPGKTWAPEVLARGDGSFVLYYTANGGGQCVGRAVARDPAGPFRDRWRGPLVCQRDEGGSIDPSPFRDDDGSLYLYWKNDGNAIGHATFIWAQRLSADGTQLVGVRRQLASNDAGWEGGVVEAPTMWKQDGRYYLFYSANSYAGVDYATGYAVADAALGPYTKPSEEPLLATDYGVGAALGPGGQDVVVAPDGATWLVYHSWDPTNSFRRMNLEQLAWEDGRPVVQGPDRGPQPRP